MEELVSESERDLENLSAKEKMLIWEKAKEIVR